MAGLPGMQANLPCPLQEEDDAEHDPIEDEEGVLHEEHFARNPSKRFTPEHHSSLQEVRITLSHIWHRQPLVKVRFCNASTTPVSPSSLACSLHRASSCNLPPFSHVHLETSFCSFVHVSAPLVSCL